MINKAILVGRLGADPICRQMGDGGLAANISIATDASFKNSAGDKVEKTDWHRCVAYGALAQICQDYLKKGRLVFIEGKSRTREWTDKDNIKRYSTEIVMSEMKMLDKAPTSVTAAPTPAGADPVMVTPINEVPF